MMKFLLQFGHGMLEHSRILIEACDGGGVILSPRDMSRSQMETLANDIGELHGAVYLDPQFYLPHADHERLVSHPYWPNNYESGGFWTGPAVTELLQNLKTMNDELGSTCFILPGVHAEALDEHWLMRQRAFISGSNSLGVAQEDLFATVALGAEVVRNIQQVSEVLEEARRWNIGGVYLVCEHPNGDYLVQDSIWVTNVLELTAGFRMQGKQVILGYCNHQMLVAASAGANAIASGTWMNVRSFPPEKFRSAYDEEIRRKTTWYYCPQSLSEYKIPTLDIAMLQGLLDEMAPPKDLGSEFADILFQGAQPSTVGFGESMAFRHYLKSLHSQVNTARYPTFRETIAAHSAALEFAEELLTRLHAGGVRGQLRDFSECIEANRAALAVLQTNRGPILRRQWDQL
jgi:hypothetical protein